MVDDKVPRRDIRFKQYVTAVPSALAVAIVPNRSPELICKDWRLALLIADCHTFKFGISPPAPLDP